MSSRPTPAPVAVAALGPAAPATPEERAILRTVTYAALFQFPLKVAELERRLMDLPLDGAAIRRRLVEPFLAARLCLTEGFVHPRGQQAWVELRRTRGVRADGLIARHRLALATLSRFPFIRLAALSGGCAHGNPTDEDVDVFLVVKRGRAWSVCGALMVLCKLAGLRRTLCLNYIVDEGALALPERDLFTGSEILGMKPLAGPEGYRTFVEANGWVAGLFPNFGHESATGAQVGRAGCWRWLEALLDAGPAPLLERLSRRFLGAYLRRKTLGYPGVVLVEERLKLHTRDHGPELLEAYEVALREAEADP